MHFCIGFTIFFNVINDWFTYIRRRLDFSCAGVESRVHSDNPTGQAIAASRVVRAVWPEQSFNSTGANIRVWTSMDGYTQNYPPVRGSFVEGEVRGKQCNLS